MLNMFSDLSHMFQDQNSDSSHLEDDFGPNLIESGDTTLIAEYGQEFVKPEDLPDLNGQEGGTRCHLCSGQKHGDFCFNPKCSNEFAFEPAINFSIHGGVAEGTTHQHDLEGAFRCEYKITV